MFSFSLILSAAKFISALCVRYTFSVDYFPLLLSNWYFHVFHMLKFKKYSLILYMIFVLNFFFSCILFNNECILTCTSDIYKFILCTIFKCHLINHINDFCSHIYVKEIVLILFMTANKQCTCTCRAFFFQLSH